MSTVDIAPIFTWFKTLLENGTGKAVGDHRSPSKTPTYPYIVLSIVPGGDLHGAPLYAPDADADIVFQVDAVGVRPDQTRNLADTIRRTVLARNAGQFQVTLPNPTGYIIADRQGQLPSGYIAEGDEPNRVYTVPADYTIRVVAGD